MSTTMIAVMHSAPTTVPRVAPTTFPTELADFACEDVGVTEGIALDDVAPDDVTPGDVTPEDVVPGDLAPGD